MMLPVWLADWFVQKEPLCAGNTAQTSPPNTAAAGCICQPAPPNSGCNSPFFLELSMEAPLQ